MFDVLHGEKHFNETFGFAKAKARLYSGMDKDKEEPQLFSLHNHRKKSAFWVELLIQKSCPTTYMMLYRLWKDLPLDLTTVPPVP